MVAAACGGFAAECPAGRRYRSIAARPAPQQHGAAALRTAANAGSATFQRTYVAERTLVSLFITKEFTFLPNHYDMVINVLQMIPRTPLLIVSLIQYR